MTVVRGNMDAKSNKKKTQLIAKALGKYFQRVSARVVDEDTHAFRREFHMSITEVCRALVEVRDHRVKSSQAM